MSLIGLYFSTFMCQVRFHLLQVAASAPRAHGLRQYCGIMEETIVEEILDIGALVCYSFPIGVMMYLLTVDNSNLNPNPTPRLRRWVVLFSG
jgi:hypothetical protein